MKKKIIKLTKKPWRSGKDEDDYNKEEDKNINEPEEKDEPNK